MTRKSVDLIIVIVATVLAVVVALAPIDIGFVRLSMGIALVLLLPGYALITALFVETQLDWAESFLFVIGTSIALSILGALILHLTPWGLLTITWALSLSMFTIIAAVIALIRRNRQPFLAMLRPKFGLSLKHAAVLILAAFITYTAFSVARTSALEQPSQGFTQLWLLSSADAKSEQVRVGFSNHELSVMRYRLELDIDSQVLRKWSALELQPGQTWEIVVGLPGEDLSHRPVAAKLYREDAPGTVYRQVWLIDH